MAAPQVSTQAPHTVSTGTTHASSTTRTPTSVGTHAAHAVHAAHITHTAHAAATAAPTTVSLPGLLLQVVIALGVIILFVWLVSKAARSRPGRMLLGGAGITGGGMLGAFGSKRQTPINIISRQMLGKGMSLVIVDVEGKLLMLGVTQHNISVLADLAEENLAGESSEYSFGLIPDSFGNASSAASATVQPFSGGLRPVAGSYSRPAAGSSSVPAMERSNVNPIDFLRELTVRRSVGRQ